MTTAAIPIIDVDTHVVEPPDLWTSRMPSRFGDRIPRIRWDEETQLDYWFAGDIRLGAAGMPAAAGWPEHPPLHPPRFSDVDPTSWDPIRRARMMDDLGVATQVLYPNVAVFNAKSILQSGDMDFSHACLRAYNDFQIDWCTAAPGRYVAIASLPFWDIELSLEELRRCVGLGHRGLAFTQDPTYFGLPQLTDPHWYPIWAAAEEMGIPVNFHIASAGTEIMQTGHPANGAHANYASMGVTFFLGNARTIAQLVTGGICHRFPDLAFVSVESGIGWIPFALEALDWQWKNCGVHKEHPEYDLLPSEYFRRQIYGCFWFERESALAALPLLGATNIMFETDYPHPTSMSPGPASAATSPREYITTALASVPESDLRLILHDNAARLYGCDR